MPSVRQHAHLRFAQYGYVKYLKAPAPSVDACNILSAAVTDHLTAGTKTMELRSKPCPPDRTGRRISLMETGTKLIKGTAILAESRALTVEERTTFSDVLQAHRLVLQTHSTQTGLQALNYQTKRTYVWALRDIHVHEEPFEVSATARRKENAENMTCTGARAGGVWICGLANTRSLPEPSSRATRSQGSHRQEQAEASCKYHPIVTVPTLRQTK